MFAACLDAAWIALLGSVEMAGPCLMRVVKTVPYTICSVADDADIRLFLRGQDGVPYGDFDPVEAELSQAGERLVFAMNAGMYHTDRSPVGHYVEAGRQYARVNTNAGPGNFHMLPNGVFWIGMDKGVRKASVGTAAAYASSNLEGLVFATQSGPMLVIEGELHHRFNKGSDNLRVRNGVGIGSDGTLHVVKSEAPVNFWDFASLFRETLDVPNALYLDGTVSRAFVPALRRNDEGPRMGPIIGLVEPIP